MANIATIARGLFLLTAVFSCLGLTEQRKVRVDLKDCGKCDGAATAIVDAGNLCLEAHEPDMRTNGGRVQVWECTGAAEQNWHWKGEQLVNGGSLCLDADSSKENERGAPRVQVWRCTNRPSQQWEYKGFILVNKSNGYCLDVHVNDIRKNGGEVQLWNCVAGAAPQQWRSGTFVVD